MTKRTQCDGRVGDLVVLDARHVGGSRRLGQILEVLGSPEHERYRVRWDDEHESIFYPQSSAARIERSRRERSPRAAIDEPAEYTDEEPVLTHEP